MADNWIDADDDDSAPIGKAQCLESSLGFMRGSPKSERNKLLSRIGQTH